MSLTIELLRLTLPLGACKFQVRYITILNECLGIDNKIGEPIYPVAGQLLGIKRSQHTFVVE